MGPQFKTEEAKAIAEQIIQEAEGQTLNDQLRGRLAKKLAGLNLSSLRPFPKSLEQDPHHGTNYYMALDALAEGAAVPLLIQVAPASAPISELFQKPFGSARIQVKGKEILMNFFPFSTRDQENIRAFARWVNPAFLPRPQRSQPAIAAGNRHPEISLPAVFAAYRTILEEMHINMASTVQLSATREMTTEEALSARDGEDPTATGHTRVSIRHLYHSGLWAAIRSGWREGYTAEADHFIVSGNTAEEIQHSVEAVKTAIRHAVGYTKFTTDTSRLLELQADLRHPQPWSDSDVRAKFQQVLSEDERKWILGEFSKPYPIGEKSYNFTREEVMRLAVKFGQSLKLNEELFDDIVKTKAEENLAGGFDFEPSIDEAETLTTAKELLFYMHWLKARGRPAQLCPPNLGFKKRQAYPVAMATTAENGVGLNDYCHGKMWPELPERVERDFQSKPLEELAARVFELAAVAKSFDTTLSIHSGSGKQAEVLERIGKATAGRVNYKISGELQLQLFDVLASQPQGSQWRQLIERMADRAEKFAAAGAFGYESELAAKYREMGLGYYLGDSARGRVDGNLFLVFWLGNIVGTRDANSPDGDHRFFKEKIDELPENLLQEVRSRNSRYIVWLAECLRG